MRRRYRICRSPVRTTKYCPTPVGTVFGQAINWPNLVYPCLFGLLIGCFGFYECFTFNLIQRSPTSSKAPSHFSLACLFFAVMNFSAFCTHCYFTPQSFTWQIMYAIDMCATSTSSIYLLLSTLTNVPKIITKLSYIYFPVTFYVLWTFEIQGKQLYWIPEFLYIGVTGFAAGVLFWKVMVKELIAGETACYAEMAPPPICKTCQSFKLIYVFSSLRRSQETI